MPNAECLILRPSAQCRVPNIPHQVPDATCQTPTMPNTYDLVCNTQYLTPDTYNLMAYLLMATNQFVKPDTYTTYLYCTCTRTYSDVDTHTYAHTYIYTFSDLRRCMGIRRVQFRHSPQLLPSRLFHNAQPRCVPPVPGPRFVCRKTGQRCRHIDELLTVRSWPLPRATHDPSPAVARRLV